MDANDTRGREYARNRARAWWWTLGRAAADVLWAVAGIVSWGFWLWVLWYWIDAGCPM